MFGVFGEGGLVTWVTWHPVHWMRIAIRVGSRGTSVLNLYQAPRAISPLAMLQPGFPCRHSLWWRRNDAVRGGGSVAAPPVKPPAPPPPPSGSDPREPGGCWPRKAPAFRQRWVTSSPDPPPPPLAGQRGQRGEIGPEKQSDDFVAFAAAFGLKTSPAVEAGMYVAPVKAPPPHVGAPPSKMSPRVCHAPPVAGGGAWEEGALAGGESDVFEKEGPVRPSLGSIPLPRFAQAFAVDAVLSPSADPRLSPCMVRFRPPPGLEDVALRCGQPPARPGGGMNPPLGLGLPDAVPPPPGLGFDDDLIYPADRGRGR